MKFSHYFQHTLFTLKKDGYSKIKGGHDGWIDEQMEIPSHAFTVSISSKNANHDKPEHVWLCH